MNWRLHTNHAKHVSENTGYNTDDRVLARIEQFFSLAFFHFLLLVTFQNNYPVEIVIENYNKELYFFKRALLWCYHSCLAKTLLLLTTTRYIYIILYICYWWKRKKGWRHAYFSATHLACPRVCLVLIVVIGEKLPFRVRNGQTVEDAAINTNCRHRTAIGPILSHLEQRQICFTTLLLDSKLLVF